MARKPTLISRARENVPLLILGLLLLATFVMGGGARGDIISLVVLRPLAILCLAIGLLGLRREHWRKYRLPLSLLASVWALIALHLVPLPPAVWSILPGRALVLEIDELAGLEGVWRPLTLVPYRGWNAFWAMAVPAAVMVLAVQLRPEQHLVLLRGILAIALCSAALGVLQVVSGYHPLLFPYRISNFDSPVGLFSNRNHQAALLCTILPMLALVAAQAKGTSRKAIQALTAGLATIVVLLILAVGSRAGLGFMVLGAASAWPILRGSGGGSAHRTRKRTWVAPAAIGAAGLLVVIALAVIFSRANAIERIASADGVEEYRFEVWRVAWDALPGFQPVGSGIGSFVEVFKMVEPPQMLGLNYWNHAHNDWLEWTLEGGVPALVLLVIAVLGWARQALGIRQQLQARRFETLLGAVGAVIILILGLWSLVDYPLRVPSLACLCVIAAVWMSAPGAARVHRSDFT